MKNITTKLLVLGLSAALLTGALTACKTEKKGGANTASETTESEETTQSNLGMWVASESNEITAEIKGYFDEAVGELDGYYYEPVACLGTMVFGGTNYCLVCQPTLKANNAMNSLIISYIRVDISGKATFLKDERIVLPGTENADDNMVGSWVYAESTDITPEIEVVMTKATETVTGEVYEPVVYVGSQLVSGTNHAILCKVMPSTSGLDTPASYAVIYIYEDLEGNCSITDTEAIQMKAT